MHTPDNWRIIKISPHNEEPWYRILAGWSGGYLDGDSWRMNSGISKVEEDGDYINFIGESGSVYSCHKDSETIRMNCAYVWAQMKEAHGEIVELIDYKDFIKEFSG